MKKKPAHVTIVFPPGAGDANLQLGPHAKFSTAPPPQARTGDYLIAIISSPSRDNLLQSPQRNSDKEALETKVTSYTSVDSSGFL
ncbi:hypothetical protein E2C01_095443 [Portunus trituberculatus]|uniref:Uncharacterized protein n=1 Tax=Portunus trituberculatus TaxID=210409 RepID=A0A5B7K072_PORTR|nr:hypothetical protein [Portunus trituberculatus]